MMFVGLVPFVHTRKMITTSKALQCTNPTASLHCGHRSTVVIHTLP